METAKSITRSITNTFSRGIINKIIRYIFKDIKFNSIQFASILMNIFFPIGGLIIYIAFKTKDRYIKNKVHYLWEVYEDIDVCDTFLPEMDIEKESDIISLKDSLYISDLDYRRKTILNMLKRDMASNTKFLNEALQNDDQETVHYVATSILNKKIKLESESKEIIVAYSKNPYSFDNKIRYYTQLKEKLSLPFIDSSLRTYYTQEIIKVLKTIVNSKISDNDIYITDLLKYLIIIKDLNEVKYYSNIYKNEYSNSELKFLTLMKSYYVLKDEVNFRDTIVKLSNTDTGVSKEVMDIVNFWTG